MEAVAPAQAPSTPTRSSALPFIAGALVIVISLLIAELFARGIGPVPSSPAGLKDFQDQVYVSDDVLGWKLRPGAAATANGITYHVTDQGTRGTGSIPTDPTTIVIVGDGDTMGWGVSDTDAYPAKLAARFAADSSARPIVNAGVMGYGMEQQVVWMEELLRKSNARTALLAWTADSVDTPEGGLLAPKPPWSILLQRILFPHPWVRPAIPALAAELTEGTPAWKDMKDAFGEFAGFCALHHVTCAVLLLPKPRGFPYELFKEQGRVSLEAANKGLRVLDLSKTMRRGDKTELKISKDEEFPSAELHQRYADEVATWIENWQDVIR